MDEEIDDEQKARINQYGSADIYTLRRLKQEIGSRPTAHVEAEAILGSRIDGLVGSIDGFDVAANGVST